MSTEQKIALRLEFTNVSIDPINLKMTYDTTISEIISFLRNDAKNTIPE